MMEKEGTEIKMEDAAGFFANIFGGDRFMDYVRTPVHQAIRLCLILFADRRNHYYEGDDECRHKCDD